ncbi:MULTISPECIES: urease accessory protein UreD [Ramlibacter]|uniref:Urease accessory protein UreD n=1 Tax=Ramlibacter aquaticus TaxID=2780094 RepID=A0ABR9SK28_9BURK|nr:MULTISPECIES: urease accessory protein UreD [Ramlibacter]MBE7942122.1 urease accessory protein UreD [Ramlibacter aquaticus]
MAWQATLSLDWRLETGRCAARFAHQGPLRVLQTLYPEGDTIAHNVLVHPPSGLVAGDTLDIAISAGPGAHGVVTTPGAGRFYRSDGEAAAQRTRIALAAGARMEWLPQETICYSGCEAQNELAVALAPGAEMMGWDLLALGLPGSGQPFLAGRVRQRIALDGAWLDHGRIAADDAALMDGPLGLAGQRCLGTFFFAAGEPLGRARREQALDLARAQIEAAGFIHAGATAPGDRVVVLRALAPVVEPVMDLFKAVRAAWRPALWGLAANPPRTWAL